MTIYIDVVLVENLIMNYIIFFATGIILKIEIKNFRLFCASLIGAIYSLVAYMSVLEIYSSIILKMILSVVIVYVAFNPQSGKKLWKYVLIFYITSFVFGGVAFALIYMIKPQEILMKNGLFLGMYPIKIIILGAVISFVIIVTSFKIVKTKISKKDMFCFLTIRLNDKEIKTKAMLDTGNFLKDPITNMPVIVVESTLLEECMPKEILINLELIIGGGFEKIPEEIRNKYITRLKIIPFSSLGKQNGMILGIKPEYVEIENEDRKIRKDNVIIGIYNKSLTKRGEYRALLGIELL